MLSLPGKFAGVEQTVGVHAPGDDRQRSVGIVDHPGVGVYNVNAKRDQSGHSVSQLGLALKAGDQQTAEPSAVRGAHGIEVEAPLRQTGADLGAPIGQRLATNLDMTDAGISAFGPQGDMVE